MPARTLAFALALTFLLPTTAPVRARRVADTRASLPSADARATPRGADASPAPRPDHPLRAAVPAPEDVLGFRPGDDRKLASWQSIVEYFRRLDAASQRVRFEELGKTTMGAPFVMATISAPENLARLHEFKDIQRRLADPRLLGRGADRKAASLIARGKTVVLITCGIHSTEVGSTLSSALIAHRLASSDDPEVLKILRETIVLLVPSLNPDGVDIVKNWYDRTLGTPFEGTGPPDLYHKYTGHDNNRDWYAFTQVETQLTVDKIHNVWLPHIVHDIHQQGANASRLFLPPYMKPVEPNVPAQIVEGYTELGLAVASRMREKGFKGIVTDGIYDAWTPARAYSHYHGGVRILSETASARIATPTNVKFENLRASSDDNYDPKKASPNFPEPWPGGDWTMRDITNYMTTAAMELLRHAADNRERWLRRFYEIGKEAVRPRRSGELYAFVIPPARNRWVLLDILSRGGVAYDIATPFRLDGKLYPEGTAVVRLAQPYGNFAKALLENQRYPNLRDAAGTPQAPYDVTAHTLSLLMDVEATPVFAAFRYWRPRPSAGGVGGGCATPFPGSLAIYKSHVPSMDEGWTRWVIEKQYWQWKSPDEVRCAPRFVSLDDAQIRGGNLRAKYTAIIIPDHSARAIFEGHRKGTMPDELTGGVGAEGVRALREFVEQGGTLVCLNNASNFAIEQLKLPVRNVVGELKRTEFYVPGSILRIVLDTSHPLAKGMPRESIAWAEDSPAFDIAGDPAALARVSVVARYPQNGNPLLSGWLLGEERLRGKAALVEVGLGRGRVVLFGFRPQYRGQSLATYPLLFNAISRGESQ